MTRLLDSTIGTEKIQDAWLRYVMLLITDRELTVQQMFARLFSVSHFGWRVPRPMTQFYSVSSAVKQVIIAPITHPASSGGGGVVWKLLSAIEKEVELR